MANEDEVLDWTRLSPLDFEDLVGDLLRAETGLSFERFGPGPDGGVDLRAGTNASRTIVQCKHYPRGDVSALSRELKKEKVKVDGLRPSRYIIATTVDLSPSAKDRFVALLDPWITNSSDVMGGPDIEGLLRAHPLVQRSHPKLWMQDATVLERLLNAGLFTHTDWTLDEAGADARVFVRPSAFDDARTRLADTHVCIIVGPPGIGKTTLARILMLEYVRDGFNPVVLRDGIDEAYGVVNDRERQIFYFDDFLGQTDISEVSLARNEDDRMLRFFKRIRETSNKRIILTTREYVLRDALQRFERLKRASEEDVLRKVMLDLSRYTRLDRARILYNHVWAASGGDPAWCEPFAAKAVWKPIVDHANYNPRVLKSAIEQAHRHGAPPSTVPTKLVALLNLPSQVWETPFDSHLNELEREILRTVLALPQPAAESLVFEDVTHRRLIGAQEAVSRDSYRSSLSTLEGTFVRFDRRSCGSVTVSFANPSVRDFMLDRTTSDEYQLTAWLTLARRPEHVATLLAAITWSISRSEDSRVAVQWCGQQAGAIVERLARVVGEADLRAEAGDVAATLSKLLAQLPDREAGLILVERLASLASEHEWASTDAAIELLSQLTPSSHLRGWVVAGVAAIDSWDELRSIVVFSQEMPGWFDDGLRDELVDAFHTWGDAHQDWARHDAFDVEEAHEALDSIEEVARMLGVDSPVSRHVRAIIDQRFASPSGKEADYDEVDTWNTHRPSDDSDEEVARVFCHFRIRE